MEFQQSAVSNIEGREERSSWRRTRERERRWNGGRRGEERCGEENKKEKGDTEDSLFNNVNFVIAV